MSDPLKKYIETHQSLFDNKSPSKDMFDQIISKLDDKPNPLETKASLKIKRIRYIYGIAASFLFISSFYLIWQNPRFSEKDNIKQVSIDESISKSKYVVENLSDHQPVSSESNLIIEKGIQDSQKPTSNSENVINPSTAKVLINKTKGIERKRMANQLRIEIPGIQKMQLLVEKTHDPNFSKNVVLPHVDIITKPILKNKSEIANHSSQKNEEHSNTKTLLALLFRKTKELTNNTVDIYQYKEENEPGIAFHLKTEKLEFEKKIGIQGLQD